MSKKDDIISAGLKEFSTYSYDTASINRIIAQSGTSKGTFYYYFADKKALYLAILKNAMAIKQKYMEQMTEMVSRDKADLFDIMKAQVKLLGQFAAENPELFRLGEMLMAETSARREEMLGPFISEIGDTFREFVEIGVRQGTFSKRYPPEFISKVIWYITMNYYKILFNEGEKLTPEMIEERIDMLFDFLKRGFS